MKAGTLDRRISVLRKSIALSPSGEPIETWRLLAPRLWASIIPLRGEEKSAAPQYVAMEQVSIKVRWSDLLSDLSPLDRIVYPAVSEDELEGSPPDIVPEAEIGERRMYDIMAVLEVERREALQIQAARRVDPLTIEGTP